PHLFTTNEKSVGSSFVIICIRADGSIKFQARRAYGPDRMKISCAYFGIAASRHSETMPNHLSLRSHSICEAVHTPCDWYREIEKNVMPVPPCFPTRTAPPLC